MTEAERIAVDCVVLAGQANSGPFKDMYDVPNEALIPAGGYALLTWVLAALGESRSVTDMIVVGPPAHLGVALEPLPQAVTARIRMVQSGDRITDNLKLGVEAASPDRWLLLATADIPLITGAMVDEFVDSARETGADFFYPVATRERVEELYPGAERTYVSVADQTFTGGNLFLVRPQVVEPALDMVDRFFQYRKNPLKLAALLGPGFIWRFLMGRLTLAELESRVSSMVGAAGKVVISRHPEVGLDVDKPSHVPLVESALAGRSPHEG